MGADFAMETLRSTNHARNRTLGILISAAPTQNNFNHGLNLALSATSHNVRVYVYLIDDAVAGVHDTRLKHLAESGASVQACAYAMERRRDTKSRGEIVEPTGKRNSAPWLPAGLTALNDLIVSTDRFVSFN